MVPCGSFYIVQYVIIIGENREDTVLMIDWMM